MIKILRGESFIVAWHVLHQKTKFKKIKYPILFELHKVFCLVCFCLFVRFLVLFLGCIFNDRNEKCVSYVGCRSLAKNAVSKIDSFRNSELRLFLIFYQPKKRELICVPIVLLQFSEDLGVYFINYSK